MLAEDLQGFDAVPRGKHREPQSAKQSPGGLDEYVVVIHQEEGAVTFMFGGVSLPFQQADRRIRGEREIDPKDAAASLLALT